MNESEKKANISTSLKDLSSSIQTQSQTQSQLQNSLLDLQKAVSNFKKDFETFHRDSDNKMQNMTSELKNLVNAFTPNVKDLDDIPGVRTPKWYQGVIAFDYNDNAERFVSIDINPEGPFVITKITPLWAVGNGIVPTGGNSIDYFTNGNPAPIIPVPSGNSLVSSGRILPCTAYPLIAQNFGYENPSGNQSLQKYLYRNDAVQTFYWGVFSDIPEFFFQVEVAGTGKFWTTQAISAAAFYGYFGQPLHTGVLGWVERGDRISIRAIPAVAVPHVGRVVFVLEGFQILGDVNISKELGY
jgi:hypothetical protein